MFNRNALLLAFAAIGLFGCASASSPVKAAPPRGASMRFISPRMQACVDRALRRDPDRRLLQDAVNRFEAGCELGDAAACSLLGVMHERGLGVPQDGELARSLYWRACEAGNQMGCDHFRGGADYDLDRPPPALVQGPPDVTATIK